MILEQILSAVRNKASKAFLDLMHDELILLVDFGVKIKNNGGISVKEWFADGSIT